MKKKVYHFTVVIEKDEDGYFVHCPKLEGCFTQGETYEEAMENIQEVIELCLEDDLKQQKDIVIPAR